jgi:hypothetical protein
VLLGDGLGPDVGDAQVVQGGGGQHAGLDVGPNPDHGMREVGHAELAQHLVAGRVALDHVGQHVGVVLDPVAVAVDPQHLEVQPDQLGGDRPAEAAEPDHGDLLALLRGADPPRAGSRTYAGALVSQ